MSSYIRVLLANVPALMFWFNPSQGRSPPADFYSYLYCLELVFRIELNGNIMYALFRYVPVLHLPKTS
jgi:hypothetical protein